LTVGSTVTALVVLLLALPAIRPTADQVLAGGVVVLLGLVAFWGGLSWWISRHYVASVATGWPYTTFEELERAEAPLRAHRAATTGAEERRPAA
jgi:ABC-type uncharacterized transport system permease subunit